MSFEQRKIRLIMKLRQSGIFDHRVLKAIERIPRELFIPAPFQDQAYVNLALPIGHGQSISQPLVVAEMTQALKVSERMKVLEIGTGSGYQAAVLACLCRRVYTIERYRPLHLEAASRFERLRLHNITARVGDGTKGWPEQAPFDRVLITAAVNEIPEQIVEQLAIEGMMVLPFKCMERGERIVRVVRIDLEDYDVEELSCVKFVPLVSGALPGASAKR